METISKGTLSQATIPYAKTRGQSTWSWFGLEGVSQSSTTALLLARLEGSLQSHGAGVRGELEIAGKPNRAGEKQPFLRAGPQGPVSIDHNYMPQVPRGCPVGVAVPTGVDAR
jgi:hypothetical protein